MKSVFLFLIAIALALFAAAVAPVFNAVWVLVWVIMRLWRMPADTARKMREQRALVQLEKGLLALTEGDFITAERALQKSAGSHGRTTARYLAAAEAADGQDAGDRAEWYLGQADTRNRKQKFLVELTRARMLTSNGDFGGAKPILEGLHKRRRKHPQVLELLARCYRELGEWEPLLKLLPGMQKAGIVDEQKAAELKEQTAVADLQRSKDANELQADWRALPKAMQRNSEVVMTFADQAIRLGAPEKTEDVIRSSLKREWNSKLLIPYGEPGADDTPKRLKQCERWLQSYPDDHWLHLTLGRLCAREELWGKARQHMIRSLEIEPTVAGYDSLGQLLERKGELELAMACFRNALRMNQGKDPLPLPGDQAKLAPPEENAQLTSEPED